MLDVDVTKPAQNTGTRLPDRIRRNYKAAVPQLYRDEIQMLLPLDLVASWGVGPVFSNAALSAAAASAVFGKRPSGHLPTV